MNRKLGHILTVGMVSVGALGGTLAWAGSSNGDAAEVALFGKAGQDIKSAVASAEKASGGQAVGAEFAEKNGEAIWEIETVAGTKVSEVKINAATGALVTQKDKDAADDEHEGATPDKLGAPLAELVTKAEAASGGRVMAIGFDEENGKIDGIEVEIVKNGAPQTFTLDATSGKLSPAIENGSGQDEADEGAN